MRPIHSVSVHHVVLECRSPLGGRAVTFDTFVQRSSDSDGAAHVTRAIRHARIRGFVGPFSLLSDYLVTSGTLPPQLDGR